uniref:Uncharacterized protein n=1 Tax=Tanacetum cinerariifolium TaxID=118510 RepID=A0A699RBL6_TANCI|nr:hypothetical protein [Tanacetum cinerariifolium]
MMILLRQTEDCDMLLNMVTTDMKLLVVEIEIDDITADDVDKISHKLDISNELAPLRRKCVEKLCVDLKLFQFHVVHIHVI